MDFTGKRIVLGVSGSIAAYKTPLLVREIIRRGGSVRVILTPSAAKFVSSLALQNLTKASVIVEMFDTSVQSGGSWHIHLAQECDAMIIAPASAATLARLATGLCDSALIAVAVSLPQEIPLLVAPAMDSDMWRHPTTQRNIKQIKADGAIIIQPDKGELASGLYGVGRLPETDVLANALANALSSSGSISRTETHYVSDEIVSMYAEKSSNPLQESVERDIWNVEMALEELKNSATDKRSTENNTHISLAELPVFRGKNVLITAGPTYEKIDDVRFIGNFSSGKMGFALAEAARTAGANVTLIAGPTQLATPEGVQRIDVVSAAEMFAVAAEHFQTADCAVLAAAVADFTPAEVSSGKLKKEALGEEVTLRLLRSPDILATLGKRKTGRQVVIGFALEAENEIENGRKKLHNKNADMIIVNSAAKPGSGFQGDDNTVVIISKFAADRPLPRMSKRECAAEIIKYAAELFG
ncbi:hypothetical protein MASR2M18_07810 [Ignavibacteria bacterium]|nr:bifunctional phosphopantothenoylcysteine decarboxylase/phosphopantothenate synthase [Bacteroidota bacterium]MCZ2133180.1 bifunctional phosphopantothenoylcysteine decarboxylase/phosphopantothenate synthase [Bacteroidota bacterium]